MKVKWGGGGGWNTCPPNPKFQFHNLPREPKPKWEVWFAWYPVLVETFKKTLTFHDEIVTDRTFKWYWLRNVARRKERLLHGWKHVHNTDRWEYAPAHKAVTQ